MESVVSNRAQPLKKRWQQQYKNLLTTIWALKSEPMPAVQRVYQAVYHQSAFAAELQSSNQSSESCWLHHLWQRLMIEIKPVSFQQASDSTKLKTGEMFWPKIARNLIQLFWLQLWFSRYWNTSFFPWKSILTVFKKSIFYGAAAVAQRHSWTLLVIKRLQVQIPLGAGLYPRYITSVLILYIGKVIPKWLFIKSDAWQCCLGAKLAFKIQIQFLT